VVARGSKAQLIPREITFGYKSKATGQWCGPQPKQALAHVCLADHLFYGGAAFGGKSEFAIVEAITTCLSRPGCEVAIFRRKHTELKKSLIPRFMRLVPRWMAKFNKQDMCAVFFNGSILWFCHCQHEDSVYTYQSAEWLLLIIDEASHFTEFQVDYLITRVRTSVPGWRTRVIFTSNPGNVGHGWLKRRFVRPTAAELGNRPPPAPMEVWRPLKTDPADPTPPEHVKTRCFIPARSEDNPAGMEADPTYMAGVWALGGDKAKQLALGDWDANDSMIVGPDWRANHLVTEGDTLLLHQGVPLHTLLDWHVVNKPDWKPPAGATIFGSVDYGYGAPWSFHLHAVFRSATGSTHTRTFFEYYKAKVRDVDQARLIREAIVRLMASKAEGGCSMEKPTWIVGDPAMWNSRAEMGISKSIAEVYTDELVKIGVGFMPGAKGRGARVSRPQRWKDALSTGEDGLPRWSVTTACPHLIRTVPEIPWDEDDPEVEDGESENHAYEGVGRFFEARPFAARAAAPDPYKDLSDDPISKAHAEALAKRASPTPKVLDITGMIVT